MEFFGIQERTPTLSLSLSLFRLTTHSLIQDGHRLELSTPPSPRAIWPLFSSFLYGGPKDFPCQVVEQMKAGMTK